MKRNKIRYKAAPIRRIELPLSGKVLLRYVDDDAINIAQKGDLQVYPFNEALNGVRAGEYEMNGFSGYFKVDVHDGYKWCLVLLNDIFLHHENHFSKKEYPLDTYVLCKEILENLKGRILLRTYREHYELESAAEEEKPKA